MYDSWSILPATQCLFNKNKVTLAEIAKHWGEGMIVVCEKPNGKIHFIAGCGNKSYSNIGRMQKCHHDQTGASFGMWKIINEIEYSLDESGKLCFSAVDHTFDPMTKAGVAVFK